MPNVTSPTLKNGQMRILVKVAGAEARTKVKMRRRAAEVYG
jgi:hypothetical protein